jgi:amino acid adenylation domain-containing protein
MPLFSTLLNYLHSAVDLESGFANAPGVTLVESRGSTNYPLALSVDDQGDGFVLGIESDPRIDAGRVLGYLQTALRSLVHALEAAPFTPALALPILPNGERQLLLEHFNGSQTSPVEERLIHEAFEAQVQRTPLAAAVVYKGRTLSYAELNARADQLAAFLRCRGIEQGRFVGICLDRGLDMVVALLGVLKAGGAYVPLDASYPPERLAYMLTDAAPGVVLTQDALRGRLPATGVEIVTLDGQWTHIAAVASDNAGPRPSPQSAEALAYVIYTSGSTGMPKGVMVEHKGVLNLWQGLEDLYGASGACRRVGLNASLSFDASVQQLVQLLSGRTLLPVPAECRGDARLMLKFIEDEAIEGIDCTPSQLRAWIAAGLLERKLSCLRTVLVGGEAIDTELWTALARCEQTQFFNVYGPTECTVDTTSASVQGDATSPHIGRPMRNRRVYVLDARQQPVPVGVAGELYLGGDGVARGYLCRPELTAERFLSDPFAGDTGARMYKTGDLGRRRADGVIEYVGRNDGQVKLRGYRIELGEIEMQLLRHSQVAEAITIAREDIPGDVRLVAYAVPRQPADSALLSVDALRAHLKTVLPEFMIPSAFVLLKKLPLSASGKVDRRALPRPDAEAHASRHYEPPTGEVEEVLAVIWQSVLGLAQVGRHDNFFELGGHSLLAMQVIARIDSLLSVPMPVRALFDAPTLSALSAHIDRLRRNYLLDNLSAGESELDEFLEGLALMSDSQASELLREMKTEGMR